MSTSLTETHSIDSSRSSEVVILLLVIQGVLTLWLSFAILPLGVVGMLANAVLAFAFHGLKRRLCAGFALAAGVIIAGMGLFVLAE